MRDPSLTTLQQLLRAAAAAAAAAGAEDAAAAAALESCCRGSGCGNSRLSAAAAERDSLQDMLDRRPPAGHADVGGAEAGTNGRPGDSDGRESSGCLTRAVALHDSSAQNGRPGDSGRQPAPPCGSSLCSGGHGPGGGRPVPPAAQCREGLGQHGKSDPWAVGGG